MSKNEIAEALRRFSTAAVLLHQAVAADLGLGVTDHKALDLLREAPGLTSSQLAGRAGVTTGAMTGVVSRLEAAGFLRREQDQDDGRKQRLFPVDEKIQVIHGRLRGLRAEMGAVFSTFEPDENKAILRFLGEANMVTRRHITLLRGGLDAGERS